MITFYNEIMRRFPEIHDKVIEGDENLPYFMLLHINVWLNNLQPIQITPDLIGRLTAFAKWCDEQPRGEDASDDIYTFLHVGFYEGLFTSVVTRFLLPHFLSREDIVKNGDYFRQWIGADNYQKAIECYGRTA